MDASTKLYVSSDSNVSVIIINFLILFFYVLVSFAELIERCALFKRSFRNGSSNKQKQIFPFIFPFYSHSSHSELTTREPEM